MDVRNKLRKLTLLLAIAALVGTLSPVFPADAAIVKTTATIKVPAFVYAGVSNPIDVAVCPKSTLKATSCELADERAVTLYANGAKVQTLTTIGGGGVATFFWTPRSSGRFSLQAKAAAKGSSRAVSSEIKTVSVKSKTSGTTLGTVACGTTCVNGIPSTLNLNIEEVITLGITSGVPKGRKVHFQTLKVDNSYEDEYSGTSTWQSDIGKYGLALSFADIDGFSDCTPGDTHHWNFRFYVDATSKSPAGATAAKWIQIICPTGDGTGPIQLDVSYSDQSMDYSIDSPPTIQISVTAPETTQYSIYSEYCRKSSDCSNYDNWTWIQGYFEADKIFGSQDFELSADPGDYGQYWLRVEVYPWTNDEPVYSDQYTLDLW